MPRHGNGHGGPLSKAEIEERLGREATSEEVATANRWRHREPPETPASVRLAAALARDNARTVERQGGDPSHFHVRADELRVKARRMSKAEVERRVGREVIQHVRHRRTPPPRPAARRPGCRARVTSRAGPGDDPPDGDEPPRRGRLDDVDVDDRGRVA